MRRPVQFITCTCLLVCFMTGCGKPSAPTAANQQPVNSKAPSEAGDFVGSSPDTKSLDVFTELVRMAPSWVQATLDREAQTDFDEATLPEIITSLGEKELYEIPIGIAETALARIDFDFTRRFSLQLNGIPLRIALKRLLQPCGLSCDYRFDQLVITTANDARDWTDQTGVTGLKPSPGSRWASILDDEHGVEFHDVAGLAEQLKIHYGVEVELKTAPGASPQRGSFSIHTARVPNRHWLRILLGRQNLTCRLDGETLVIEPLGE